VNICVYVSISAYVFIYVCGVCFWINICECVCVCVRVRAHIDIYIYKHTYVHVSICARVYLCKVYICMHICMHV